MRHNSNPWGRQAAGCFGLAGLAAQAILYAHVRSTAIDFQSNRTGIDPRSKTHTGGPRIHARSQSHGRRPPPPPTYHQADGQETTRHTGQDAGVAGTDHGPGVRSTRRRRVESPRHSPVSFHAGAERGRRDHPAAGRAHPVPGRGGTRRLLERRDARGKCRLVSLGVFVSFTARAPCSGFIPAPTPPQFPPPPPNKLLRLPLSFKTRVRATGAEHRHIVLALRLEAAASAAGAAAAGQERRWGSMGISRIPALMDKPVESESLAALVQEFKAAYAACGHELLTVYLGLPLSGSRVCVLPVRWRALHVQVMEEAGGGRGAEADGGEKEEEGGEEGPSSPPQSSLPETQGGGSPSELPGWIQAVNSYEGSLSALVAHHARTLGQGVPGPSTLLQLLRAKAGPLRMHDLLMLGSLPPARPPPPPPKRRSTQCPPVGG
jgi:hypothetical protein